MFEAIFNLIRNKIVEVLTAVGDLINESPRDRKKGVRTPSPDIVWKRRQRKPRGRTQRASTLRKGGPNTDTQIFNHPR